MVELLFYLSYGLWLKWSILFKILWFHLDELTANPLNNTILYEFFMAFTGILSWTWQRLRYTMSLCWHPSLSGAKGLDCWSPAFCIEWCIHSRWFRCIISRSWFSICTKKIIWSFSKKSCSVEPLSWLHHISYSLIGARSHKLIVSWCLAKSIIWWTEILELFSLINRFKWCGFILNWVFARTSSC